MSAQHYDIHWLKKKADSGGTLKFIFFWGHSNKEGESAGKFCFSQWYESPFTVDAITYNTTEHWMMAHKALLFQDKHNFEKIIQCNSPAEAKKLGREVIGYDDRTWNVHKFNIVILGNIHKFNQNPAFAEYLLNTGDRILVEASPVDAIWGIGLSQDSKDINNVHAWRGENLLGFALMEVRDFLRGFGHFKLLQSAMETPWKKYPEAERRSLFWRMGKGEDYLTVFHKYYTGLNDREKQVYRLTNPEPCSWTGFYG